jgi:transketolase
MRNAFAAEITEIARKSDQVVLLSGDIGNRLFDGFKEVAPERFFNCGIAEANMISAAAGMAMCGLRPVAYTITPFITARCFEQIKLDLCYHNLPVIFVGTGSGLSYASLGASHHSMEDLAILRSLPNLTVICPGDSWELRATLHQALKLDGPVYIRIGKKGEPEIHSQVPELTIGKAIVLQEGSDVCILSTGNTLALAVECAELLASSPQAVSARVVSFHTVKPLDEELLKDVFSNFSLVITLEEHSILGGFGGSIAEWQSSRVFPGAGARLLSFGAADAFLHEAGNQQYARQQFGLTSQHIVPQILDAVLERHDRKYKLNSLAK